MSAKRTVKPLPVVRLHYNTLVRGKWIIRRGKVGHAAKGYRHIGDLMHIHSGSSYIICRRKAGQHEILIVEADASRRGMANMRDPLPGGSWIVCPDMDYAIARALTMSAGRKDDGQ